MTIENKLLTMGSTHGRTGKAMTPKGIVVHYVGNPGSTALANRNWFENGAGGAYTSAHYIIGLNGEILLAVPENECAQHAGKAYASQYEAQAKLNNSMYIGIENCHPNADGKFNDKTMASLVDLCADICNRYGFVPSKDIFRHYDVTGKSCPLYYVNNRGDWNAFLAAVTTKLGELQAPPVATKAAVAVKFNLLGKAVDIPGQLINGSNYVAARALLEALGYTVGWDGNAQTIVVGLPKTTVKVDLFGKNISEVPGWLAGGTNYVAIRALLEAMDFEVGWENDMVTVR